MDITEDINAGRGLGQPLHNLPIFIAEDHESWNVKNRYGAQRQEEATSF